MTNNITSPQIHRPSNWVGVGQFWSASVEDALSFSSDRASGTTMLWSITHRQTNPTVERLRREISQFESNYHDGWDGPGTYGPTHEAVKAIFLALDSIPSGIVLPKAMLSPSGDIGLYWDFANNGYADLSADTYGRLSFFSRDDQGTEQFDDVSPIVLGAQWYWSRVGKLSKPSNLAA